MIERKTGGLQSLRYSWLPFEEARAYVHALDLKSSTEWRAWATSNARPDNIPSNPQLVYQNTGWVNLGDWLGTGYLAPRDRTYQAFEEARTYVHALGLKSSTEWRAWAKTREKPDDIPADPRRVYKTEGWISMGDWLGTDIVAPQNRRYLPFEEARDYVRGAGLMSKTEWAKWSQSSAKPDNIPASPSRVYKDKGWVSWGDWLGTGFIHPSNRRWLPFEEARVFARGLGLPSSAAWSAWAKTGACPDDIPRTPDEVYQDKGWKGWGDWLGTEYIASQIRTYRPFAQARTYIHSLGLKSKTEWKIYAQTISKPIDIPNAPNEVYQGQGWISWGDWLGTGYSKNSFRDFPKARAFARNLELKNRGEWEKWARNGERPNDIPTDPRAAYKDKGWVSWGDWLGTGFIHYRARVYLPFEDARAFTRKLGLKSIAEWRAWAKTQEKPNDIPADPARVYKGEGWVGWADWLGFFSQWNRNAVLSFLYSLEPVLPELHPTELFAILRQNGMAIAAAEPKNSNAQFIKSIQDLCSASNRETAYEELVAAIEKQNAVQEDGALCSDEEGDPGVIPAEKEVRGELPTLHTMTSLKAVDFLIDMGITSDEETLEFLVSNRVSGLWQAMLRDDNSFDLNSLQTATGGTYFNEIRNRFLTQYEGAINLPLPAGYSFQVAGVVQTPNLMQRLTAQRVLTERRIGNWSGVGAGKTLSAILTSRVIDARLTVIIAFNSTISAWTKRIKETYPDSQILDGEALVKMRGAYPIDREKHNYLILNFEMFQQSYSADMVRWFVEQYCIDFIVLDEIQSVKQRSPRVTSRRRAVIGGLLSVASERNAGLCVLGMSATPVINNLNEAKALLEMIRGVEFSDLKTFSSIANASAMHEKLILYGIRYKPPHTQTIEETYPLIDGEVLLPRLLEVTSDSILALERILLDAKMDTIVYALRKHTLIYTFYLDGLVQPLRQAVEKAGFTVGMFTGDDKTGLNLFKNGKVDVLIGSQPVGTGVDGLQYLCNRLIVVSLPWTSAEYEQLVGRLYRQGSTSEKIDRTRLTIPLPETAVDIARRRFGDFSMMNSRFNNAYSQTTHHRLRQNPEEWYLYHTLYRQMRQTWPEIPYEKIANSLKKRPDWVIGDFGCGEAKLAECLPNTVYSFDHIAINENVIACDMAQTPLNDETLDVVVFSLALMGLNYIDYLKEAYRVLKPGGFLKIAETLCHWHEKKSELLTQITQFGFLLIGNAEETDRFLYINAIKAIG